MTHIYQYGICSIMRISYEYITAPPPALNPNLMPKNKYTKTENQYEPRKSRLKKPRTSSPNIVKTPLTFSSRSTFFLIPKSADEPLIPDVANRPPPPQPPLPPAPARLTDNDEDGTRKASAGLVCESRRSRTKKNATGNASALMVRAATITSVGVSAGGFGVGGPGVELLLIAVSCRGYKGCIF